MEAKIDQKAIIQWMQLLRTPKDVRSLRKTLSSIRDAVTTQKEGLDMLTQHLGTFGRIVLEDIGPSWVAGLGIAERTELIDSIFVDCQPLVSLCVVLSSMKALGRGKSASHQWMLDYCVVLLKKILDKAHIERLCNEVQQREEEKIARLLLSVPDQIFNVVHAPPSWCEPIPFVRHIALHSIGQAPQAAPFLGHLFEKMALLGHASVASNVLVHHTQKGVAILGHVGIGGMEPLVAALVQQTSVLEQGVDLLDQVLPLQEDVVFFLTQKFILHRAFDLPVAALIVQFLHRHPPHLMTLMKHVAGVWKSDHHIAQTPWERQRYVTHALCWALWKAEQVQSVVSMLLEGVRVHMVSPQQRVRELGMVVAEQLSRHLSEKEPMEFERPSPFAYEFTLQVLQQPFHVEEEEEEEEEKTIDPLEQVDLLSLSAPVEEEDSDDSLEAYDLDEKEAPPMGIIGADGEWGEQTPMFLRDLGAALVAKEAPTARHALQIMEQQIRNHMIGKRQGILSGGPGDLEEVAAALAARLLHLSDEYNTKDFVELRLGALQALVACAPMQVSPYLAKQVFAPNYALGQRTDCLHALERGSKELSSGDKNRFTPEIASSFVFSLMRGLHGSSLELMARDAALLAHVTHVLGRTMEWVLPSPGYRMIGKHICAFILAIRWHTQPAVRRACLFGMGAIVRSVSLSLLMDDVGEAVMEEIRAWLSEVMHKDEDALCRQLASGVVHIASAS